MSTHDLESLAAALRQRLAAERISQAELARRVGQPPAFQAAISRLLRGEPVSAETARRVGRALGVTPPPRRLVRRCMTPAQAAAWDALTHAQRDERLGVPCDGEPQP